MFGMCAIIWQHDQLQQHRQPEQQTKCEYNKPARTHNAKSTSTAKKDSTKKKLQQQELHSEIKFERKRKAKVIIIIFMTFTLGCSVCCVYLRRWLNDGSPPSKRCAHTF